MNRRDFFKGIVLSGLSVSLGGYISNSKGQVVDNYPLKTNFPEKENLILYSERPPLLETPREFFDKAITSNELFFVRWHLSDIPTFVDLKSWRLKINGNVNRHIELSMGELKTKFEPVSFYAALQCSGNGRNFFNPKPKGIHWNHGAMGNALWTGVRLKDILEYAGIKTGSIEVAFNGLDKAPYPETPDYIRSFPVENFPLRLIVPGWYATHWIKSVSEITVLDKPLKNFWMEKAYKLPDNDCECVKPGEKPEKKKTISSMDVKSVIAKPKENAVFRVGDVIKVSGIAFDYGSGIKDVLISIDGGKNWKRAYLGPELGRYSFREWFIFFKTEKSGNITVMSRAINKDGHMQPFKAGWNPGGYKWNAIDTINITVL